MEWEPSRNGITRDLPGTRDHPPQAAGTGSGDRDRAPSCPLTVVLEMFIPQENKKPAW